MRAIDLEPGCGEPPLNVYDTSGPYTDPAAKIDIQAGLPNSAASGSKRAATSKATTRANSAPRITASSAPTARAASRNSPTPSAAPCAPRPA